MACGVVALSRAGQQREHGFHGLRHGLGACWRTQDSGVFETQIDADESRCVGRAPTLRSGLVSVPEHASQKGLLLVSVGALSLKSLSALTSLRSLCHFGELCSALRGRHPRLPSGYYHRLKRVRAYAPTRGCVYACASYARTYARAYACVRAHACACTSCACARLGGLF